MQDLIGKKFVRNDTWERVFIPVFWLNLPPQERVELKNWEEKCLIRNFKIDYEFEENWEIKTVDLKEFLENQKMSDNQELAGCEVQEVKRKKSK